MRPIRLGVAWCVLALGLAGTVGAMLISVRAGGYLLAALLAATALARLVLPTNLTDGVAVRSRMLDFGFYLVLAIAVAFIFSQVKLSTAG